jgi:hypothetical protein
LRASLSVLRVHLRPQYLLARTTINPSRCDLLRPIASQLRENFSAFSRSRRARPVGAGAGADHMYEEGSTDNLESKDAVKKDDSLDGGPGRDTGRTDRPEKAIVGFP